MICSRKTQRERVKLAERTGKDIWYDNYISARFQKWCLGWDLWIHSGIYGVVDHDKSQKSLVKLAINLYITHQPPTISKIPILRKITLSIIDEASTKEHQFSSILAHGNEVWMFQDRRQAETDSRCSAISQNVSFNYPQMKLNLSRLALANHIYLYHTQSWQIWWSLWKKDELPEKKRSRSG